MTKRFFPLLLLMATLVLFQACNPDCESLPASNITMPPGPFEEGTELAIVSNPANFMEGREIHLSLTSPGNSTTFALQSRFEKDLGAAIVELPNEINSSATFLIDDPDCTGSLIPIGAATSLVDAGFFVDNPFFITPTPPLVIIPTPPVTPPLKVINAWFSPQNQGLLYLVQAG